MNIQHSEYINMELLRFSTAGSVDDGKSTLIGRLLYDSKAIFEDQWQHIEQVSNRRGEEYVNLALLTDGLKAEREQGITIDVAYRYFSTPKRKFIIADTPGHIQYTRNMVTGSSTANLSIILVDARIGILEQTIRHAYISSLLQIPHVVICVNKMDLVDYSQEVFEKIKTDFLDMAKVLEIRDVHFIPISALLGDNIVDKSDKMGWYNGSTLMYLLENVDICNDFDYSDKRFPVQYVIRPQSTEFHDYRGYAGRVSGGVFTVGETVKILPSGLTSKVKSIDFFKDSLDLAITPQSVIITLEDNIDISRGDMLVCTENPPHVEQEFDMMVCWLGDKPMALNGRYIIRHTTQEQKCIIKEIQYKVDINSLKQETEVSMFGMNDIGRIRIKTTKPLFYDPYHKNKITGSIILIDEGNFNTVCAGMII